MEKWISFLQMYDEILTEAALVVLAMVLVIILVRVLRQIKRLNRSLSSITENVQAYFDVIMQEESETSGEKPVQERQQTQEVQQSNQAETEESLIEREYRKQEEEKVFNAVLQEYFS